MTFFKTFLESPINGFPSGHSGDTDAISIPAIVAKIDFLWWLSYGESFGFSQPIELNLSVIKITFGLMFKINISSIIGMILAIFIYRKV